MITSIAICILLTIGHCFKNYGFGYWIHILLSTILYTCISYFIDIIKKYYVHPKGNICYEFKSNKMLQVFNYIFTVLVSKKVTTSLTIIIMFISNSKLPHNSNIRMVHVHVCLIMSEIYIGIMASGQLIFTTSTCSTCTCLFIMSYTLAGVLNIKCRMHIIVAKHNIIYVILNFNILVHLLPFNFNFPSIKYTVINYDAYLLQKCIIICIFHTVVISIISNVSLTTAFHNYFDITCIVLLYLPALPELIIILRANYRPLIFLYHLYPNEFIAAISKPSHYKIIYPTFSFPDLISTNLAHLAGKCIPPALPMKRFLYVYFFLFSCCVGGQCLIVL